MPKHFRREQDLVILSPFSYLNPPSSRFLLSSFLSLSLLSFFSHTSLPFSFLFTYPPLPTTTKLNTAPENLREAPRIFRNILDALPRPISTAWPVCYIVIDEEEGDDSTVEAARNEVHKMKKRKKEDLLDMK